MKAKLIFYKQTRQINFKNFFISIKFLLILLLLHGAAKQGNAQCEEKHAAPACNIYGPLKGCVRDGRMFIHTDIAFSSNPPERDYTLERNTGNAKIIGTTFVSYVDSVYSEIVELDPGTQAGFINLQVIVTVSYPDNCLLHCECSKSITVRDERIAASYSPILCHGGTSTLTASGLGGASKYSYILQPGGITNSTGIFTGLTAATYTVTVFGTKDFVTCSADTTITITQPAANPVNLICPDPVTEQPSQSQQKINSDFGAWLALFKVSGGTNTVVINNLPQSPPSACGGFVDIIYTVKSDCEADVSCTKRFTVLGPNNPVSTNDGPITCANATRTVSVNNCDGAANTTYSWTGPNGFKSSLQCPVVVDSGTYIVVVTNTVSGCTGTASTYVSKNATPPNASAGADKVIGCLSTTVQLSGSSSTPSANFKWIASGGGHIVSGENTATPIVDAPGLYTLTVTDPANGCTNVDVALVTLATPPAIVCSNNGPMTCNTKSVTLSANGCKGSGITYSWSGPYGFTSALQCPAAVNKGIYMVTATATATGCTSTCTTTVDSSCFAYWGCTLGFWKNHTVIWDDAADPISACLATAIAAQGYSGNGTKNSSFASAFGVTAAEMTAVGYKPGLTLLQALQSGGGGFNLLARQGVAALINTCGLSGHYTYASAYVLISIHNAIVTKTPAPLGDQFASANEVLPDNCPPAGKATKRLMNDAIAITENVMISAYPNPFTDKTTIQVLPGINYTDAAIELYDLKGKKVKTLYTGAVAADKEYRFEISGLNLEAGIYIYSFRAGDETIIGKVVLIK